MENAGLVSKRTNTMLEMRIIGVISRAPDVGFAKKISENLARKLLRNTEDGCYKLYGAVLWCYSTNTICPHCMFTLLTLQNSHKEGEFLSRLVAELNGTGGDIAFEIKGYNSEIKAQERSKLFVTANKKFDHQARDLAAD